MPALNARQRALEAQLLKLDDTAMLLGTLDGFLAGIHICPKLILPSEWLPHVWGPGEDDGGPAFESHDHIKTLMAGVLRHSDDVADALARGRYRPVLESDEDSGEVFWEFWAEGFDQACRLRPDAWTPILEGAGDPEHEEASASLSMLAALCLMAVDGAGKEELDGADAEGLAEAAPELIPMCVKTLYEHRIKDAAPAPAPTAKPGRNSPCPCGSGKKFKVCCGKAE
jgi:uncharacterized protein